MNSLLQLFTRKQALAATNEAVQSEPNAPASNVLGRLGAAAKSAMDVVPEVDMI